MQWNIGGGRIRKQDADPTDVRSYNEESIDYLAYIATKHNPDIITLQETHQSHDGSNQAEALADKIGLSFWRNDIHDESHIEKGQWFGQAILSRFQITDHTFKRLPNPRLTVMSPEGLELRSHNYGITSVGIDTPLGQICVRTFHLPALHFFDITPDMRAGKDVLDTVSEAIVAPTMPTILSSDFNLNVPSALKLLPILEEKGFQETPSEEKTTPKGKQLDHILHSGFPKVTTFVDNTALTDHFPLIADIESTEPRT